MLTTRQEETLTEDGTNSINTSSGCPQGGVLPLLIWGLVVDWLLLRLNSLGITSVGYADAIVLLARSKSEATLSDLTLRTPSVIAGLCRTIDLSINPKKKKLVCFRTHNLDLRRIPSIGVVVDLIEEIKFFLKNVAHKEQ